MSACMFDFLLKTGKNGEKHRNQQTIRCQVLACMKKMWICLVFIYVAVYYSVQKRCPRIAPQLYNNSDLYPFWRIWRK